MARKKHFRTILLIFVILAIVFIAESCDLSMMAITRRIENFEDHLNTDDRDNIFAQHFHPDANNAWASALMWEGSEFDIDNRDFVFTSLEVISQTDTTATVTGTMSHKFEPGVSIEFTMGKTATGWYIKEIYVDGAGVIV